MEPTNQTHRIVIIAVVAILFASLSGGGVYYYLNQQNKAQENLIDELQKKSVVEKEDEEKTSVTDSNTKEDQQEDDEKAIKTLLDNFVVTYKDTVTTRDIFDYFTEPTGDNRETKTRWLTCNNSAGTDPGGPCFGVTSGATKTLSVTVDKYDKISDKSYKVTATEKREFYNNAAMPEPAYEEYSRNSIFEVVKENGEWLIDKYYPSSSTDKTKYEGLSY